LSEKGSTSLIKGGGGGERDCKKRPGGRPKCREWNITSIVKGVELEGVASDKNKGGGVIRLREGNFKLRKWHGVSRPADIVSL
jgi:hypothetical protein